MAKSEDKRFQSGFVGDYSSVDPIYNINKPIEFENCTGTHWKPMHRLVQQVYEFQDLIYKQGNFFAKNRELELNHTKRKELLLKWSDNIIAHYSAMKDM